MILHQIELHIPHELPHLFCILISYEGQHAGNESVTSQISAFIAEAGKNIQNKQKKPYNKKLRKDRITVDLYPGKWNFM